MAQSNSIPLELGTQNIGKLLKQYALPAIIAQIAASLYNMVDSIFIGQGVGPLAISGLAVTFPLMNLSTAFGTLVGAGAATMLSVLLGQKNYGAASKVLGNVVSLNVIIGLIFMTVAHAAPAMPMSNTNMKIGSRMALSITVNMVSPIALRGLPVDLMAAFRPK